MDWQLQTLLMIENIFIFVYFQPVAFHQFSHVQLLFFKYALYLLELLVIFSALRSHVANFERLLLTYCTHHF